MVITIDVNENFATQGVQRRGGLGLSRSESASECLPPGLYFPPFSTKTVFAGLFLISPAAVLDTYNCTGLGLPRRDI